MDLIRRNGGRSETEYLPPINKVGIINSRSKVTDLKFNLYGEPFKIESNAIRNKFLKFLLNELEAIDEKPESKRKTNAIKYITLAIESVKPLALFMLEEKVLPTKNKIYEFINSLISSYGFEKQPYESTDRIKNLLKLPQKNRIN